MKLLYEEKSKSIQEVNKFISDINAQRGKEILAKVIFENPNGYIISDTCNCYISFEHGYQQYVIQIDWSYSDDILKKNNMHRGYNTNYQKFKYLTESKELLILDNDTKITITEGD